MNDAFLPGNGFDTYETQDRVLVGLTGSRTSRAVVRILQQQGFAVVSAVVKLANTPEEAEIVKAAKEAAAKLGIECVTLNAAALCEAEPEPVAARLDALLTAADKLGVQYIATGHHARIETSSDGTNTILAPAGSAPDESGLLCALPPETLARLILPLGEFDPEDLDALAEELKLD